MPKQLQGSKIGIYMRLSRDDEKAGESMSIEHQRIMLEKYVKESGGMIAREYVDDGYSGTDFDRPGVQSLLSDAQAGKIDTILVKDLSRFGRNYIRVGQYIDYIFPAYGIRFIALSDNVDTADRSSTAMDMMPIMNVFNEWHAANTSKKIRAVLEASRRAGKYTSWNYPYGYRAGKDEKRTAVIDEEAAEVVRRIFDLRLQGNSARTIAQILTFEGIPNPATHYTRLDGGKWERNCSPYWAPKTVRSILSDPTYLGTTTQHKTERVSYKNHRTVNVPEKERIVTEHAHEPIIAKDIWEKVQASFTASRGRADRSGNVHPLSGLIVCPDCGKKFKYKTSGGNGCFVCRTYADLGKRFCPSHRISEDVLEQLVLEDLRSLLTKTEFDETKARERFLEERKKQDGQRKLSDEKQLKSYRNRLAELEKLLQSAFEETVLHGLPGDVFAGLSEKYRAEREKILKAAGELEERLSEPRGDVGDADEYVRKLKGYGMGESLTREMCLRLVDHITVGNETDGEREIHIYYHFCADADLMKSETREKSVP